MAKPNLTPPILSQQDVRRFWSKVDKTPGQGPKGKCWIWTGYINSGGYGGFHKPPRLLLAHRVAVFLVTSKWPTMLMCHDRDNPPCVNPACLWEGTSKDNSNDSIQKGRHGSIIVRPEQRKRGEDVNTAKLTEEIVRAIRRRYRGGGVTMRVLGAEYGVKRDQISYIIRRLSWTHI